MDTHTHTHGQTQIDFIICPMLYAIAMGQIITLSDPYLLRATPFSIFCVAVHIFVTGGNRHFKFGSKSKPTDDKLGQGHVTFLL